MYDFQKTQYQFTRYLRDPASNQPPLNIEDRRLGIYRDLIYNNIEGFISGAFPILRSLIENKDWHSMVRDFVARHQSQSPYFLEISQEFLHYLMQEREAEDSDYPFMLELAHYEWVELAVDVSTDILPVGANKNVSVLDVSLGVSPLAWCLSYRFPVHKIGPDFRPLTPPDQNTFLVVYRNDSDEVKFLEANELTIRLLQLLEESKMSGRSCLEVIARETQHQDLTRLLADGKLLLEKLLALNILLVPEE